MILAIFAKWSKYMKKRLLSLLLSLLIIFSLLAGCGTISQDFRKNNQTEDFSSQDQAQTEPSIIYSDKDKKKEQDAFDLFLDGEFQNMVSDDSITLALRLKNPEKYGITSITPSLGDYSTKYFENCKLQCKQSLDTLNTFKYEALTTNQQYTYDIYKSYLETDLKSYDYYIYLEPLAPISGIQSELSVIFSEYPLNSKEDIETCLTLINMIPDFFISIMNFEREKGKAGCFMSEHALKELKEQCSVLSSEEGYSGLITALSNNISLCDFLTNEEKTAYSSRFSDAVKQNYINGYSYILQELDAISAEYGCNNSGLALNNDSKKYYELLLEAYTGSGKSVSKLKTTIESAILNDISQIYSITGSNPDALNNLENYTLPHEDNPEEALKYLLEKIKNIFPEPSTSSFTVKNVDKAMEDMLSPAFYLIPPIDDINNNTIYINNSPQYDSMDLFPTLAHEGYPGHLYQTTYFASTNPHPLRQLLNFIGYQEGWAKYAEIYSFELAGLDSSTAALLELDQSYGFGLYCRIDIGIHYEGWNLNDVKKYLLDYGITDTLAIEEIYYTLLDNPGVYMQYYIGYLEITEMRDRAYTELGDDFSLLEFHRFILTSGPCQFYLLQNRLDLWIDKQKAL